jgi:hypothetical protein
VDEICAVLEYYAAYSGNLLRTFRNKLSDPFGRGRKSMTGFFCDVGEICPLVGYCAAYSGYSLPTFRDNISVPSSRVKNPALDWIS